MAKRKEVASKTKKTPAKKARLAGVAGEEWRGAGLCAMAQADGVPCTELGRKCEECEKAEAKFSR